MIYDLQWANETETEIDLFLGKGEVTSHEDFASMLRSLANLQRITPDRIARFAMTNFRYEFGKRGYSMPYHYEPSGLRLYCILWNAQTLIIGNGCSKDHSGPWQGDEKLEKIIRPLEALEVTIERAITNGFFRDNSVFPGFFVGKRNTPSDRIEIK